MPDTTFHNVTITIEADTPEDAYKALCSIFDEASQKTPYRESILLEYQTDTYSVGDDEEAWSTEALWPKAEDG
jgi:hypothetical protein